MITNLAAFNARLPEIIEEHPDTDTAELAPMLVDEISPAARRAILIHLTVFEVEMHLRFRARRIEDQARALAAESTQPDKEQEDQPDPEVVKFARLYDDPTVWNCNYSGVWFNGRARRRFVKWVNRRDGKDGFDAWLSRALDLVNDENFRYDWIPDYADTTQMNIISKYMADYADTIRFEVTAELLDTVFATGDGTRVTWRDATVAQHEERIDMLAKMIDGTAETAAMHMRAVQMIKDAGVENLAQLTDQKPIGE